MSPLQAAMQDYEAAAKAAATAKRDVLRLLRPEREVSGISLREAARRCKVSPASVSHLERGIWMWPLAKKLTRVVGGAARVR